MNRTHPLYAVLIAGLLAAAPARAQDEKKEEAPPAPPPASEPADTPPAEPAAEPAAPPADPAEAQPQPEPPPPPALPGLDELLGTGRRGGNEDPSQTELDRRLSGQDLSNAFKEAVQLMSQAAVRLKAAEDPERAGLGTQRVQEDAVRKLDQLIAQIEQNARQRSRSSSSSSSQQNQQQSQPQQQQRSAQRQQDNQGENNSENQPPARRDGPLRPELDSARASWGALPQRVRDMLMQGSTDRFSSMYEKMTEEYYRRLAEERRQR